MPGWETSHSVRNDLNCGAASGSPIETWESGFLGVPAADAEQFVELNAFEPSTLFQTICLENGDTIDWQFSHRGRNGTDIIRLTLGTQLLTTESTSNTAWTTYTGSTVYTGPSGDQDFFFEAVGSGSTGNFLDNIQIFFLPYVEFLTPAESDFEASGGSIPRIKVSGSLTTAQSIDVVITASTANLTDYSFVSSVTIPAGSYDATAANSIPINLTILDNLDLQADRTITFGLANPTGGITITDSDCDNVFLDEMTYTIIDDDDTADLSLTKTDDSITYTPGASSSYTITVTNNGPANVANAIVTDNLPTSFILNTQWTCVPDANSSCITGAAVGTTTNGIGNINQGVDIVVGESIVFSVPVIYSNSMTDY